MRRTIKEGLELGDKPKAEQEDVWDNQRKGEVPGWYEVIAADVNRAAQAEQMSKLAQAKPLIWPLIVKRGEQDDIDTTEWQDDAGEWHRD